MHIHLMHARIHLMHMHARTLFPDLSYAGAISIMAPSASKFETVEDASLLASWKVRNAHQSV